MFKRLFTVIRGAAAQAEEKVADRSALLILDQQIRDAAAAIERSKRALALAIAQDEAEGTRLEATLKRIADLEGRALAALAGAREDLAAEAAEAIALMEADLAMGAACLLQSSIMLTKTLRDVHESTRMVNRIEDARAERLLMEIERGKE